MGTKKTSPASVKPTYTAKFVYEKTRELALAYLKTHKTATQQEALDIAYKQVMSEAPSKPDRIMTLKTYIAFGNTLLRGEIKNYKQIIEYCLNPEVCGEFERTLSSEKVFPDAVIQLLTNRHKAKHTNMSLNPESNINKNVPSININGINLNYVTFIKNGIGHAFPSIVLEARDLALSNKINFHTIMSGLNPYNLASMETSLREASEGKKSPFKERGQNSMYLNYTSNDDFLAELYTRIAYYATAEAHSSKKSEDTLKASGTEDSSGSDK